MFLSGGCLSYFTGAATKEGFFPGVKLLNTNWQKNIQKCFKLKNKFFSRRQHIAFIFSVKEYVDHYLARPSVSFCDRKHRLDSFCFTKYALYCSLICKPKETDEGKKYQPDFQPGSLSKVTMKIWIILKLSNWWILMEKFSVIPFLGIVPQVNIDFQR